ncbi:MAG: DoxX family protein [Rhizobiaceae bacterium]
MFGWSVLVARVLLATMFLVSGWNALSDIGGTTAYFAGLGLPMPGAAAVLTGVFELAGGIALLMGLLARPFALALAAFTLAATFIGHYGQGDGAMAFWHMQMFLKDIAVAGGLAVLAVHGPGELSIDARRDVL